MSTAILDAYRFPSSTPVTAFCRTLTPAIDPVWRNLALRAVALTAMMLAHEPGEGEPTDPEERFAKLVHDLSHDQVSAEQVKGHNPTLLSQAAAVVDELWYALNRPGVERILGPFDLNMEIAFMDDPKVRRWTYAKLYTEHRELREAFEAMPGVEPYEYDNRSDQPEELTATQWSARERTWGRVLGESGRPADACVTWRYPHRYGLAIEAIVGGYSGSDESWLTPEAAVAALEPLMQRDEPLTEARRERLLAAFRGKQLR